jgi:pimeloyl-ACP methyl ester carboxylesterase
LIKSDVVRSRRIELRGGGHLACLERGIGLPLVWVHGLLSSKEVAMDALISVEGHRVIAFDQRGHGESLRVRSPRQARLDRVVLDVVAVFDAFELDAAVVGGESMGAAAVLAFAVDYPDRVLGLMIDRPAFGETGSQAYAWPDEARMIATVGVDGWMERSLSPLPTDVAQRVRRRYEQAWKRHDVPSIAVVFEALADWRLPSLEKLCQVPQRAIVRGWSGDNVHPLALAELISSVLPDGHMVRVGRALQYDADRDRRSLAECIARIRQLDRSNRRLMSRDHESPAPHER